ncbi:fimbrial protein [Salmonella enterica subsp. enterica serovar Portland]|uniref:fimbrial-like protein n=1 Tax=Salmonella enterica TaxID=28901 RepID=UPI0012733794|nr:fimbrial-like protein [Salmonella enterica]EBX6016056.1 fimbrial protein [Salmonella enterica subsp. enterica serovar Dortmund]ECI3849780.1 fimbrial protein [Salmonella enterica subsp. enterica]EDH5628931.1 fimbrial protein [Salmonella enterica subsp. enterica serovar Claibornei]EDS6039673.1 fimbrial protein [Salmonella enterica subsp. enterica serovar Lexington]EEB9697024.1 fimbrial protein [Salmonella enterica subsp. enterica serovar Miami]EEJ7235819.1 fimbrial protein [Salmonella enteri
MLAWHHNFTLYTGLVAALFIVPGYSADQDVDIIATVVSTTCQTEFSDNGIINLGTVGMNYFPDNVTAETDLAGGKTFTITVLNCNNSAPGITPSQLKIDFKPKNGQLATGNLQVFANEEEQQPTGAKNVGIVIFSMQPGEAAFNVLGTDGSSRAVYPVTSSSLEHSSWQFYARMQRVVNTTPPEAGEVKSSVLVDVHYE